MPPAPLPFSQPIADEICTRLADGESLRAISRDPNIPSLPTIFKWLHANESFATQYARAREAQAETLAAEIIDIADDARNDWMERLGDDGQPIGWVVNGEHVQRSRLRIDSRKWAAGKLKPKVFGDRLALEHSGSIEVSFKDRTDEELLEELVQLLTAGSIKLPADLQDAVLAGELAVGDPPPAEDACLDCGSSPCTCLD